MAYAVANLVEILEQYYHHYYLDLDIKPQIGFFLEKARSFRDFLINYSSSWLIPKDLEIRIIDVAHKAEDIVEIYIRNQTLKVCEDDQGLDLTSLVQEFESIKEAMEISNYVVNHRLPVDNSPPNVVSLPRHDPRRKNKVVLFEDDFQTLKARLIEGPSQLQIIPIYGTLGMGKKTLARRLYDDFLIASQFKTCVWINAGGRELDVKFVLLNLLDGLGKLTNELHKKNIDQLGALVRKTLKNNKYFIVFRDVYAENWVKLRRFFPDNNVRSRILFTTYSNWDEETVSAYGFHHMRLMTASESWMLLCHKTFGQGHCPHELEPIGRVIIETCKGIPQVVASVAGILATSEKTLAVWERIATTLASMPESEELDIVNMQVAILIYIHLPYYLKPCLLYIGALEECCDIQASKIVKLWIAEGFVKQTADNSLEDIAEAYLEILINKNLLSLTREESNGRVKAFQIQPMWRAICLVTASSHNFLSGPGNEDIKRRVSARQLFQPSNKTELLSLTRSLLYIGRASRGLARTFMELRMLRVLDVFHLEFYQFPAEILQLVLLRFLAFSCHSNLPNAICKLRNLQTLIIRRLPSFRAFSLPSELWEMTQLRHVKCKETFILYYPKNGGKDPSFLHGNLQTLSNMQLFGVTNEFLGKIPNIRKLGIFCNIAMHVVFDLARLDKLETLKCSSDWSLASRNFLAYLTLPQSLRKLTLSLCRIPSEFMEVVGSLPKLEQLKLKKSDFLSSESGSTEPEWEPAEGEFPQLLSLEMIDLNLVHWKAHVTHFPRLRHLIVRNCYAMVEIPLDIGDIKTLELIQVDETSPLALASAVRIKEKCKGRGNEFLQVHTTRR